MRTPRPTHRSAGLNAGGIFLRPRLLSRKHLSLGTYLYNGAVSASEGHSNDRPGRASPGDSSGRDVKSRCTPMFRSREKHRGPPGQASGRNKSFTRRRYFRPDRGFASGWHSHPVLVPQSDENWPCQYGYRHLPLRLQIPEQQSVPVVHGSFRSPQPPPAHVPSKSTFTPLDAAKQAFM